jgi:SAM-dependent methyltransferase
MIFNMPCIFCGSNDIVQASYPRPTEFNNKIFKYSRCRSCGLVYIDPIPTVDDYNKMYSNAYHDEFYFKEAPDYSPLFKALDPVVTKKSIVDYGCGDGSFLRFFKERGYQCTGVEYDPSLVQKLRNQNPSITFFTVDEFWASNDLSFAAIFFGDVLEHLAEPAVFLEKLHAKMEAGSFIMAQGPLENNRSLGLSFRKFTSSLVRGKKRIAHHTPYHISFTTARNQEMLFKKTGFQKVYYKILETPWPLPAKFSGRPVQALQYLVGQTSVLLSKLVPARLGNRFVYIGKKD